MTNPRHIREVILGSLGTTPVHQGRRRSLLIGLVLVFQTAVSLSAWASDLNRQLAFSIPAQPLDSALIQFSTQAQLQVIASSAEIKSLRSEPLFGTYSIEEALKRLLEQSGLSFKQVGQSAISIGHFSGEQKAGTGSSRTGSEIGGPRAPDRGDNEAGVANKKSIRGIAARIAALFAFCGSLSYARSGCAQSTQPARMASDRENGQHEEIIVTAQKRSERLQEVPVSDTVVTADQLSQYQIDSGSELARRTPNLRVSLLGDESQPKFALRGISTPEFNLNAVSPTGVFYDDVYVASPFLGGPQIFDLDRVEVLRGPQGTLFGKNTTGGAIDFVSRTPSYAPHASATAEFGDYGYYHVAGMAETPILTDTLAGRAAFDVARSAGFIRNVDPRGHSLSNIDRKAGRISIAYKNAEGLDALLRVFASEASPKAIGAINQGILPGGLNAMGVDPRINPYNGQPLTSSQGAYDRSGDIEVRGTGINLTVNNDFGSLVLTSISSYLEGHFKNLVDADGTFMNLLHVDFYSDTREISEDLRIATRGQGPFKLIAGVYYFQDRAGVDTLYDLFDAAAVVHQQYTQRRRSYAGYVDGTYDVAPALTGYVGIRWTDDRGDIHDFRVTPSIPGPLRASYHDASPTGRAGIRWKVGNDMMAYAQYARGSRSSAINGGALTGAADFTVSKPEKVDSYEIGVKSQWFDRRLTANASAFVYDFSNQQFINVVGIDNQQLENAGRSRIEGLELEAVGQLTRELQLSIAVGLLHSVYKTLNLAGLSLAGNELIEAPHHTLNLGLDYTVRVPGGGALLLHGDALNVGAQFFSAYNSVAPYNLLKTPSFWDANARFAWRDESGRYEIAIWGKNLFGNEVATGMQIDPTTGTLFRTVPYPARYGVEFGIRF